jgi:hypothetical protein
MFDNLPSQLNKLELLNCYSNLNTIDFFNNLPRRLEFLIIDFAKLANTDRKILLENLPNSLESLVIRDKFELDKTYSNIKNINDKHN